MTETTTTTPPLRFYVKTFDADEEFVREIRVEAGSAVEAALLANANLTSEEHRIEVPPPFVPMSAARRAQASPR